jgi:hypothetical protein
MAIPPPSISGPSGPSGGPPLQTNSFVIGGYSVQYLGPFKVIDCTTHLQCRVSTSLDITREIAPQWQDNPHDAPPGAIQDYGSVTITFAPAKPGRRYRLRSGGEWQERRYDGPPVPRSALPKPPSRIWSSIKGLVEFFGEADPVRLAVAGVILLGLIAGGGTALYWYLLR